MLLNDYGDDKQSALGDVLPKAVDVQDSQSILQNAEQNDGKDGTDDCASSTLQSHAAERRRRDGLQFKPLAAGGRLTRPGAETPDDGDVLLGGIPFSVHGVGRTREVASRGLRKPLSGQVLVDGSPTPRGYRGMIRQRFGYTPESRKEDGIIPMLGVDENTVVTDFR